MCFTMTSIPTALMLHFPRDRPGAVFIGICDWGMATWIQEEAPFNYGKKAEEDLRKHRAKYYCAAPELFHMTGETGNASITYADGYGSQPHHQIGVVFSGDVGQEDLQDGCNFNPISTK